MRLDASDAGFEAAFTALVNARREADADVSRDVAAIVAAVRDKGDAALKDYTARFDGHDLDLTGWEASRTRYYTYNWIRSATTWAAFALFLASLVEHLR